MTAPYWTDGESVTLRAAADILDCRSGDPRRSPPAMAGLAVMAAGLRREAGRTEDETASMTCGCRWSRTPPLSLWHRIVTCPAHSGGADEAAPA